MKRLFNKFWKWYEKNYKANLKFALFLFSWQLLHLVWMGVHIVIPRLFHIDPIAFPKTFNVILAVVDYTEIPVLISVSFVYINELRKDFNWKSLKYLLLLNTQWLHLFWITDEIVVEAFTKNVFLEFPLWLAWVAILIDYLELPVMYDTLKKYLSQKKIS